MLRLRERLCLRQRGRGCAEAEGMKEKQHSSLGAVTRRPAAGHQQRAVHPGLPAAAASTLAPLSAALPARRWLTPALPARQRSLHRCQGLQAQSKDQWGHGKQLSECSGVWCGPAVPTSRWQGSSSAQAAASPLRCRRSCRGSPSDGEPCCWPRAPRYASIRDPCQWREGGASPGRELRQDGPGAEPCRAWLCWRVHGAKPGASCWLGCRACAEGCRVCSGGRDGDGCVAGAGAAAASRGPAGTDLPAGAEAGSCLLVFTAHPAEDAPSVFWQLSSMPARPCQAGSAAYDPRLHPAACRSHSHPAAPQGLRR